jgi:hypothetical protein
MRSAGLVLPAALLLARAWAGEGGEFELAVTLTSEAGRKTMVVAWVEDREGKFIKTLGIFCKHSQYYKELTVWRKASNNEARKDLDGVVSATVKGGGQQALRIPSAAGGRRLLEEGNVIRFEANREEGRHESDLKIKIGKEFKGGTFEGKGYIAKVEVKLPAAEGPPGAAPGGGKGAP